MQKVGGNIVQLLMALKFGHRKNITNMGDSHVRMHSMWCPENKGSLLLLVSCLHPINLTMSFLDTFDFIFLVNRFLFLLRCRV
jgi:hypothetical protein